MNVKMANRSPLNQAAAKFLPVKERNNGQLHVLSLMRWGRQNRIASDTKNNVRQMIASMAMRLPLKAAGLRL